MRGEGGGGWRRDGRWVYEEGEGRGEGGWREGGGWRRDGEKLKEAVGRAKGCGEEDF